MSKKAKRSQDSSLADPVTHAELQDELRRLRAAVALLANCVGAHIIANKTAGGFLNCSRRRTKGWTPVPDRSPHAVQENRKTCRHDYWFGWDMRKRCVKCGRLKQSRRHTTGRENKGR